MLKVQSIATVICDKEKLQNEYNFKTPEELQTKDCCEDNFLSNHKKPVFENLSFVKFEMILPK